MEFLEQQLLQQNARKRNCYFYKHSINKHASSDVGEKLRIY